MSDRFVSGGTIGAGNEITAPSGSDAETTAALTGKHNAEWEAVQKELEAERQKREDERRKAAEGGERSLYDILEANKAAKQAAFEEQSNVRNQFRALDDDEIDFLDEVREKKRLEEDRVRRETEEGLKAFRNRQKDGPEGGGELGEGPGTTETWGVGRKRKRVKDKDIKGVVKRRVSEDEAKSKPPENKALEKDGATQNKRAAAEAEGASEKPEVDKTGEKKPSLGLVDYGSDDSD